MNNHEAVEFLACDGYFAPSVGYFLLLLVFLNDDHDTNEKDPHIY